MEKLILLFLGACVGASIALIIDCIRDVKATNKMADNAIKQINELDKDWQHKCGELRKQLIESCARELKLAEKNIKLRRELEAQKAFIEVSEIKKAKAEKITYGEF